MAAPLPPALALPHTRQHGGRRRAHVQSAWGVGLVTARARRPGVAAAAKRGRSAAAVAAHLELAPPEPLPFEFLESRVQVPPIRPGTVSRTALVNRLRASTSNSVATLTAPAGYGKTTLLSQWAARDPRSFAWVTVDDRDNDPVVLLSHIAAALARTEPLHPRVVDALRAPGATIWSAAVPRVAAELSA